jgi:hypothetical protein
MSETAYQVSELGGRATFLGTARVYLYDIDTREEITPFPIAFTGNSEAPIRDGVRYRDARLAVQGVDMRTRKRIEIVAAPGRRVAAKLWYASDRFEWVLLVSCSDGWQGNEADTGRLRDGNIGRNKAPLRKACSVKGCINAAERGRKARQGLCAECRYEGDCDGEAARRAER